MEYYNEKIIIKSRVNRFHINVKKFQFHLSTNNSFFVLFNNKTKTLSNVVVDAAVPSRARILLCTCFNFNVSRKMRPLDIPMYIIVLCMLYRLRNANRKRNRFFVETLACILHFCFHCAAAAYPIPALIVNFLKFVIYVFFFIVI